MSADLKGLALFYMENHDLILEIESRLKKKPEFQLMSDLFELLRLASNKKEAYPLNAWVRELAYNEAMSGSVDAYNLYKKKNIVVRCLR